MYNTGTVSQAWLHVKHAAHRLVQHMLQVTNVEMAWTDESTLAIFFDMRYWKRSESSDRNVNQATMTNGIDRLLYRSSH